MVVTRPQTSIAAMLKHADDLCAKADKRIRDVLWALRCDITKQGIPAASPREILDRYHSTDLITDSLSPLHQARMKELLGSLALPRDGRGRSSRRPSPARTATALPGPVYEAAPPVSTMATVPTLEPTVQAPKVRLPTGTTAVIWVVVGSIVVGAVPMVAYLLQGWFFLGAYSRDNGGAHDGAHDGARDGARDAANGVDNHDAGHGIDNHDARRSRRQR
ncbi:hypothetical protein G6O67_006612 [Ophiocordyceps sinensis]|uniref:Uncharacterized protein n=1 Tax=Ophiocordyceps sinensis TaxID=72228 RepID=A0A8H4LWI2_9HYPO|nr:hypothetical protein G6O67_006612 [Ophiocordyceps sinensis]